MAGQTVDQHPEAAPASPEADGVEGENRFRAWLDAGQIDALSIAQDKELLARLFRNQLKRPDFLVLFPCIGLIAVDVKHHKLIRSGREQGFTLAVGDDLAPAAEFERVFRCPLWFAFTAKDQSDAQGWHFISLFGALEQGEKRLNRQADPPKPFLFIPLTRFETILEAREMPARLSRLPQPIGFTRRLIHNHFDDPLPDRKAPNP